MGTSISIELSVTPLYDSNSIHTGEIGDTLLIRDRDPDFDLKMLIDPKLLDRTIKPGMMGFTQSPCSGKALIVDCTGPRASWEFVSSVHWSDLPHKERDQFQQKPLVPKKEWTKGERKGKPHNPVNQPRQSQTSYKKRNGLRQK